MSFRGVIKGHTVQLAGPTGLPDGTQVEVVRTFGDDARRPSKEVRRTRELARLSKAKKAPRRAKSPLAKILCSLPVQTGITDLAAERDLSLYGSPKRGKAAPSRSMRKKA